MDHPLRSHIFLVMKNGKGYTNKLIKLTFVFFLQKDKTTKNSTYIGETQWPVIK